MDKYIINAVITYRVPEVEDALTLREELEEIECGELTNFSYTTKYNKKLDEEYQVVKAKLEFTSEKEPETRVSVKFKEGLGLE